jgi:hypothetical protein
VIFRKDFHIFPPRSDEIPLGISRALRGIYIDKDETQGHSLECHRAPLGALRGWTAALISVFIYKLDLYNMPSTRPGRLTSDLKKQGQKKVFHFTFGPSEVIIITSAK